MSEQEAKDGPVEGAPDAADDGERHVPLKLEESSAGSTQPVDDDQPDTVEPISDSPSESKLTAGSDGSDSSPGGTTGGFETLLGKLVVTAGLVTEEEVEECAGLLKELSEEGEVKTLPDLLVTKDFITRHQLNRLKEEFDAKKSGQHIPGFKIIKKLGSGAMATVFLARQMSLDRLVAVKILPQKFSNNEKFIGRFYKEGRAAAQLNHPNIVQRISTSDESGELSLFRHGIHRRQNRASTELSVKHNRVTDEARARADHPAKPPRRSWNTPTPAGSSTATSNPKTSCSPRKARS